MKIRDRLRAWLLTDEEQAALDKAVFVMEFERQQNEIADTRELIDALEATDLNEWEKAAPARASLLRV